MKLLMTKIFSVGVLAKFRSFVEKQKIRYFIQSISNIDGTQKILFGPGFNIDPTFTNHDIIIAGLLRHSGAEIHYAFGRKGFKTNYPFFGGRWGNANYFNNENILEDGEIRAFKYFNKLGYAHDVSDYIRDMDIKELQELVSGLSEDEMLTFQYQGISIGHDAMNTVRNLNMVDQISLVENYADEWRAAILDCMVYSLFFERLIHKVHPDVIFSHDCFYMPWSLLGKLADKHGIKFYNYYMGLHPDTWVYANRKPSMEFELMDSIWATNINRTLSYEENNKLDALLADRRKGIVGNLTLETSEEKIELEHLLGKIGDNPFAVYYSNVFWDLTALDKEIIFKTIEESIFYLIEWFENRPQLCLVLKSHPAEKHKLIPETFQTVGSIIEQKFKTGLPENIIYLDSLTNVSSYDLYPRSACTLAWTGTSGMESAMFGTPCISLANAHYRGKGFTIDPVNINEIDEALTKNMTSSKKLDDNQVALARKYFYLFRYEFSKNVGIPTLRYGEQPTELKWKTAKKYLKNEYLKNTINSILSGKDI